MKTTEVFFKDVNFVGREIENVQDLVKAVDAGMDIAREDGIGYCKLGEREVEEDEDGNYFEQYEKSEEELFGEMKEDLDDKITLYAGFFLDYGRYSIKQAKTTTYQSNFRVGQEVYLVRNNKIVKAEILRLWLSDKDGKDPIRNTQADVCDISSEIRNSATSASLNNATLKHINNVLYKYSVLDGSMVYIKYIGNCSFEPLVSLADIFATKEELVKHLMEG